MALVRMFESVRDPYVVYWWQLSRVRAWGGKGPVIWFGGVCFCATVYGKIRAGQLLPLIPGTVLCCHVWECNSRIEIIAMCVCHVFVWQWTGYDACGCRGYEIYDEGVYVDVLVPGKMRNGHVLPLTPCTATSSRTLTVTIQ